MSPNNRSLIPLACLFHLAALSRPAAAEVIDRVAAVVNDAVITWSEVRPVLETYRSELDGSADPAVRTARERELIGQIIDRLIKERLLDQEIREAAIAVTEADLDRAIGNVMEQHRIPDIEAFKDALATQGIAWDGYRKQIGDQIRKWRFLNRVIGAKISVTDREIEELYAEQYAVSPADRELHLLHIFIPVDTADPQAARMRMAELLGELDRGGDFPEMARRFSRGPSASDGGDLGWMKIGGFADGPIRTAVAKLETGQTTPPVEEGGGLHLLKLLETRQPAGPPLDEVRAGLQQSIQDRKLEREIDQYLAQKQKTASIKILVP